MRAWITATATRPLHGVASAAVELGVGLERRVADLVLHSGELERVIVMAVESPQVRAALEEVMSSQAAQQMVDIMFDSALFDRVVDRLLASDAMWRLIDDVATSPAVLAAVSQQGLGFADQIGEDVRRRSRRADDWLERAAQGLIRRRAATAPQTPGTA
jgi:hypothetical protein